MMHTIQQLGPVSDLLTENRQARSGAIAASARRLFGLLGVVLLLGACASTPEPLTQSQTQTQTWIAEVENYQYDLPKDHPDLIQNVMAVSQEMRDEVRLRFDWLPKYAAGEAIAHWLLEEEGRFMQYDVNANLPPIQAWEQRRGNCLSFTMLLVALAEELNVGIEFNAVDIPDTWGMEENLGMVYYRHVNGVYKSGARKRIFDLAMDIYDAGYPQRTISRDHAMALLQNNRAIEHLGNQQSAEAEHAIKLGISFSPDSADMWLNLGVILKRQGNFDKAEIAFNHAHALDRYNTAAISNLERFYREQGQPGKARQYLKQAERARRANPYYHYKLARNEYREGHYRKAMKAARKAIMLHDSDPRFYELKSVIAQRQGDYKKAILALADAYEISTSTDQRGKYLSKVERVTQHAIKQQSEARRPQSVNVTDQLRTISRGILN